jgi:hypothetical protein
MPNKYTQSPRENKNAASSPNLPVKTFRLGRIKAAVWENEGEQKFYSVTFARTYMDEANKYHDSDSFGRDDLPLVAKLADQAHTFIFERLAESKTNRASDPRLGERPVIPAALYYYSGGKVESILRHGPDKSGTPRRRSDGFYEWRKTLNQTSRSRFT